MHFLHLLSAHSVQAALTPLHGLHLLLTSIYALDLHSVHVEASEHFLQPVPVFEFEQVLQVAKAADVSL